MSARRTPVSVRRTANFDEDLAVLQRGGLSASDAVRQAVNLIAQAHRAVEELTARDGQRPAVLTIRVADLISLYDVRRARTTPVMRRDGGEPQ